MVVDFSKINLKERPMLVLKTQSDEVIQTLGYAFNVEADLMYNEVSTLTFDLPAYVNGVKTPNYDEVKGTRIVDFVGVGLFILVDPTTENDGTSEIKHCKAYSLEYEFTKKQFYIAGNEDDVDEDGNVGYKMVYQLYDGYDGVSNTETIISRIHEKMPEWTFEVDTDLYDKFRTFDSDVSDNVYNFIKSTVQETYGCIFDFDTYNRHVKVISTESTVAQRQVYLSQENLIKTINIDEDSDSVVTSLDVSGEEGVSIRFVNPTGQNNIYDLHYFLDELPASLRTKWNEWTAACEAQRQNYFNLAMSYQVKIADILTEEVKLVDLEGELKSAETVQGAEVSKPDPKQSDLDAAKAEVAKATNAVNAQKGVVNSKMAQKNSILKSIQSINYSLAWEPVKDKDGKVIGGPWKDSKGQPFTATELKILRRYFFEDSVEDSSFALATTNSYTNKDVGSGLKNITINITNDSRKIERANSSSPVYSFAGGKITVGTNPNYVAAKIVRGTAEVDPSTKKVILTAYLERGDYSQTDFEDEGTGRTIFDCGTITLTGTYTKMSYNGSTTQEGIFAGTSLILQGANVQVYFSKNTSEFEQYSVEWDLFNYGKEILQERSEPSYTFNVESGNFLVIDDYFTFQNDLKLGQRVYLNLDGTMKTPYVTSVHVNYEDLSDFKIEFCNTYRASDSSFRLSQLLEQSIRLGKSLNIKGGMYSQFQATGAQNAVKEFMNSALDIAKNNVLSSENQAITFDESGLRLRKWNDKEAGTYEDEQIWMNDNTIAFTDDNWSTAKIGIGKIIDPNISGTGEAYGIAAPYLVGTVLAGSNLVITANNHSFKIDGNGIRINTDSLLITNSKGQDVTFTQTIKNAQDEALSETGKRLKDLMSAMDDEMNVFNPFGYSDALPTYAGGARDGDLILYRDSQNRKRTVTVNGKPITLTSGYLYRIQMSGTTITNLEEIPDKSLADAVESASKFQDTVDGKSVVYARTTPPGSGADESSMIEDVDHGDLWICTLPVGQSASHDLVKGGTYSGGKMYRWNGDKNTSYYRKWILVEDPDIDRKATALGNTMKELMQVLDPNDTDMNLYRMEQNDVFDTVTAGAENGDLLYFVGTSKKIVTINGKNQTLNPDSLYRIVVSGGKITALNEETDEAAVAAIKSASNFQNFTDYKSTVYAEKDPPVKDKAGVALDANDDGDIWFCIRPTEGSGSSAQSSRVDDGTGATQGTYRGGKMYRYSHPKWIVVEDPLVKEAMNTIGEVQSEIAAFYKSPTSGGDKKYLVADIIKGTIDASATSMSSAKATGGTNFYIDEYGYWFADKIIEGDYPRSQATTAIWINDKGILYGHKVGTGTVLEPVVNFKTFSGDNYDYESGRNGGTYWVWTTSINHQGITTQALAAQTLTGVTITGASTLQIGEISAGKFAFKVDKNGQIFAGSTTGNDNTYNFTVDKNGKVTAKNGTFAGTLEANDIIIKNKGSLVSLFSNKPSSSTTNTPQINSEFLSLKGLTITNSSGQAVMEFDGAGNGIKLYGSRITWASNVPKANVTGLSTIETNAKNALTTAEAAEEHALDAEDIAKKIADGTYSGTFIDEKKIYSPEIYSTTFSVVPAKNSKPTTGGFEIWGYFANYYKRMLQIKYTDAGLYPQIEFNSDYDAHAKWNFADTMFLNNIDFTHATVTGLNLRFTE